MSMILVILLRGDQLLFGKREFWYIRNRMFVTPFTSGCFSEKANAVLAHVSSGQKPCFWQNDWEQNKNFTMIVILQLNLQHGLAWITSHISCTYQACQKILKTHLSRLLSRTTTNIAFRSVQQNEASMIRVNNSLQFALFVLALLFPFFGDLQQTVKESIVFTLRMRLATRDICSQIKLPCALNGHAIQENVQIEKLMNSTVSQTLHRS